VGDDGGRDEDAAVEVGEEELGAVFVTVEADDAEVFGTDELDAGMKHAARLAEGVARSAAGLASAGTESGHETSLQKKDGAHLILAADAQEWYFFIKTNIPGDSCGMVGVCHGRSSTISSPVVAFGREALFIIFNLREDGSQEKTGAAAPRPPRAWQIFREVKRPGRAGCPNRPASCG